MTRERLKRVRNMARRYRAKFKRYGLAKTADGSECRSMLLNDVEFVESGEIAARHLWISPISEGFGLANLEPGCIIEFTSVACKYTKRRKESAGRDKFRRMVDYTLKAPKNVVVLSDVAC